MSDEAKDAPSLMWSPTSGVVTISHEPIWQPTGRLRWAIPSAAAYSAQPSCARLQQEWVDVKWGAVRRATEWRDVPIEVAT